MTYTNEKHGRAFEGAVGFSPTEKALKVSGTNNYYKPKITYFFFGIW